VPVPVVLVTAGRAVATGAARFGGQVARGTATVGRRVVVVGGKVVKRAGGTASRGAAKGGRVAGRGAAAGARRGAAGGRAVARPAARRPAGPRPPGPRRDPRRPRGGESRLGDGHRGDRGGRAGEPRRSGGRSGRRGLRRSRGGDGGDRGDHSRRRGRRRGPLGTTRGMAGDARRRLTEETKASWHGGDQQQASPFTAPGGLGRRGRASALAAGAGSRGLRWSRRALGLPFKAAGKVGGLLSPRKKIKTWGRRIRRLVLVVVALMVFAAVAPTAVILSDGGGQELAALLSGGMAAEEQARQRPGSGTCPPVHPDCASGTGPDGAMGAVSGIPFAEAFNRAGEATGIDPRLLAAVAWVETSFREDLIECRESSPTGARGIMQLMPGTARQLGVDPCDPEDAIPGGARYLKGQKEAFGTWENALAAYNWGPGAYERWARDPDSVTRPQENVDYAPKVVAKWEEYKQQFPDGQVGGGSPVDASAERQAILQRAQSWLDGGGVEYSQELYHDGWRQDCSGYVSMAWDLRDGDRKISATTVTMASTYAAPISREELLPGDIMLDADGGDAGHVVLFERWDADEDYYWGYEQSGSRNTGHRRFQYAGYYGPPEYRPYRLKTLAGDDSGSSGSTG
jgi:transglycosylase-like protein with SLT domain